MTDAERLAELLARRAYDADLLLRFIVAAAHAETAEQRRAQRISWVYGNLALSNPNITREMVEKAADAIEEK